MRRSWFSVVLPTTPRADPSARALTHVYTCAPQHLYVFGEQQMRACVQPPLVCGAIRERELWCGRERARRHDRARCVCFFCVAVRVTSAHTRSHLFVRARARARASQMRAIARSQGEATNEHILGLDDRFLEWVALSSMRSVEAKTIASFDSILPCGSEPSEETQYMFFAL